ncbi:flagellar basal body FlaE domain-containing protein [Stutzerimonas degradans]|uniref:flagellar hook protein FlgE n=1 Tax=Stutzerimonas sp. S1 TaxID=3030652 RepID=UPI00028D74DB|nr:flagellar hook protein FlgE [Stutzerimonas sp. S1]EKM97196.1 flagellar basal body FlaE domain-containing protein [Stutzerimonas degradans]MCW3147621.1 flagellar hook protein FlgE [Stutzerimonas sp. S1]
MSFNIALTGLSAVNEQLNTIGNNIANSGTVGFKSSRTDFGSLYAETQAMGVEVIGTTQSISQGGALTTTNRTLDLAISGGGFFVTRASNGDVAYTRAGIFGTDKDSYITNSLGQRLQGYPADATGNLQTGTVSDLQLRSGGLPARATDALSFVANLDANGEVPAVAFDPLVADSYNSTYTTKLFDSQGKEHTLTQYFVKTADNNWDAHYYIDGASLGAAQPLSFDSAGVLAAPIGTVTLNAALTGGVAPLAIDLDYTGSSQYGSEFSVTSNRATGYAAGEQTGMAVEKDGRVYASYSNGERLLQGQVVLASFVNAEGLKNISGTAWNETAASGAAMLGAPGVGQYGTLASGALESSNVDLTQQLVGLMEGQRNYQANTQVISTNKELTQVLFNAL